MEASKTITNSPKTKNKKQEIKRTTALNILALILFAVYPVIIVFSVVFSWQLHAVWCSVAVVFIGVYLLVRAVFFHVDSNYLLGLICLLLGGFSALNFFAGFVYWDAVYFALLAASFLLVYLIFRQNIYIILFALSGLEVLLLIVNKAVLSTFAFIVLQAMLIALVFVVFLSVTRIKKEKVGAVSNK